MKNIYVCPKKLRLKAIKNVERYNIDNIYVISITYNIENIYVCPKKLRLKAIKNVERYVERYNNPTWIILKDIIYFPAFHRYGFI